MMRHRATDVIYLFMYEVYQSHSSPSTQTPFCIWDESGRFGQMFAYNNFVLHTEKLIDILQQDDVCSSMELPARTADVICIVYTCK